MGKPPRTPSTHDGVSSMHASGVFFSFCVSFYWSCWIRLSTTASPPTSRPPSHLKTPLLPFALKVPVRAYTDDDDDDAEFSPSPLSSVSGSRERCEQCEHPRRVPQRARAPPSPRASGVGAKCEEVEHGARASARRGGASFGANDAKLLDNDGSGTQNGRAEERRGSTQLSPRERPGRRAGGRRCVALEAGA
jgi:hypothetical protein